MAAGGGDVHCRSKNRCLCKQLWVRNRLWAELSAKARLALTGFVQQCVCISRSVLTGVQQPLSAQNDHFEQLGVSGNDHGVNNGNRKRAEIKVLFLVE